MAKEHAPRWPPATTLEGRENQLVAMAADLAERQLREGTASAQVITHFLKLGSTRNILEARKLEQENVLLAAKAEAYSSSARIEELMGSAIEAMRGYSGHDSGDYDEFEDV